MAYLNKYALIARDHLKKHQPEMYADLRAGGHLNQYLSNLGEHVSDMIDNVRDGIMRKKPVQKDFMKHYQQLVWANQAAEEIALNDLVFNALPREEVSD